MKTICLLLLACAPSVSFAQENMNHASVGGRVTDPSGAAISGARVTARNTDTNLAASAFTSDGGRFGLQFLAAGNYQLTIHKDGFSDFARLITLRMGAATELPVQLAVSQQETSVLVGGESALLETSRSQLAGNVSQNEISTIPLNGRNFLDLALLIPGVSPTNTASNQLFAETSAVPGQGISVGSQRNFSNNFIVDGLSANDDAAGLSGVFYGLDVVQEFQVVTSGGQAEFGRALGGYINMITKSGTNTLHGSMFGYFRNQRLNAANPLSHMKLPATQAQYGASLGGPVVHDRTFYFANFERRELNQSGLITISPENVSAINARLAEVGYAGGAGKIATGLFPSPVHSDNVLAKLDHQFSSKDQFTLRYSLYDVHSLNSRGAGALNAASASASLDNTDQTVALGNVQTVSSQTVHETRAQFTRSRLAALPSDLVGPAVTIQGVATFGTLSGSPTGRVNDLYELVDNISRQTGAHAFRVGVDFLFNDLRIDFPRAFRGSYSFSSLANFLRGTYNNAGYVQTLGNSTTSQSNPNAGFYVQDEWKANSRLTFNAGLRYDLQFLQTIATDAHNFSPRLGFAWTPFTSRDTVVRGGYGLFYDRIPLRALANALLSSGNTTTLSAMSQVNLALSPGQAGAPEFPAILPPGATLPAGVLVNFTTMEKHIQNAYSEQANLEVEHRLGGLGSITVGYQHLRGLHLIASINQNAPLCVASGTNNGCRPNPAYGNNSQYSSRADSHYDGLHVSFLQRPARWGTYRVAWTYSKALDNVGEFFFSSPIDNRNIWRDYGRSDDDQRQRLVFEGMLHGRGFELSGMLQYYSALPLNITSGVTTVQGTAGRPLLNGDFIGRNTGTGNDFFGINARLARTFRLRERVRLEAMLEAFNLLNHRNNLTKNGVFGAGLYPVASAAGFGQVTAVNDSRVLQAALRLNF